MPGRRASDAGLFLAGDAGCRPPPARGGDPMSRSDRIVIAAGGGALVLAAAGRPGCCSRPPRSHRLAPRWCHRLPLSFTTERSAPGSQESRFELGAIVVDVAGSRHPTGDPGAASPGRGVADAIDRRWRRRGRRRPGRRPRRRSTWPSRSTDGGQVRVPRIGDSLPGWRRESATLDTAGGWRMAAGGGGKKGG